MRSIVTGVIAENAGGVPSLPDIDMTGCLFAVGTYLYNPAFGGKCFRTAAGEDIAFVGGEADWASVTDQEALNRWLSQAGGGIYFTDGAGGRAVVLDVPNKCVTAEA